MRSSRSRSRSLLGAALALMMLVPAALPAMAQSAEPAPALEDLTGEGSALANRFLEILGLPEDQKATELESFLADEFQIVRATGVRLDKAAYIAAPASVAEFAITEVVATQHEDLVVVSYLLATTETIDGVEQTTTAPRLSVFHWNGTGWQLAAHANFGALDETEPAPSASPAA